MNGITEAWKDLRIGDRVRFVRMPWDAHAVGYYFATDTRRLFEKLIGPGRPARVFRIDEYGLLWIRCRFRRQPA